MREIVVHLQPDHIARLSKVKKPLLAIAEMVWNSLDADATEVEVILQQNSLGGLEQIEVRDNGHGIEYEEGISAFENLGGSRKKARTKSPKGRLFHGKAGKGRFRAYALGTELLWDTWFRKDGEILAYSIQGKYSECMKFIVSDPEKSKRKSTGTNVTITDVAPHPSLMGERGLAEFTEYFAIYLQSYPNIRVRYAGTAIDPSKVIKELTTYTLPVVSTNTEHIADAQMTIIEWVNPIERALYLCSASGFPLERTTPGIQAPHFHFTVYVKSRFLERLDEDLTLALEEMNPDLRILLDAARQQLRAHFRERESRHSQQLVEDWKRDEVYPYKGNPRDILEQAERQVFDVLALNVNEYLPGFQESDTGNKKLLMGLLRQALIDRPGSVQKILTEVLGLKEEKQVELAELLERTSLTAIINASKTVADRLDFLAGLESLIFDFKKSLKERKQLHKILEEHSWIFGEEFHLAVSDESLTAVLEKHLQLLGQRNDDPTPVVRDDGSEGIIDLMLSRTIPQTKADEHEHLIVELKRPSKKIDMGVYGQISSYATAVTKDERFNGTHTRWVFWAVSNEISADMENQTRQLNQPQGLALQTQDYQIWVKSWSQILNSCKARLRFFQERLEYSATRETGIELLRKIHSKYLPSELTGDKR